MRLAYRLVGAHRLPQKKRVAHRLAWSLSVASVLLVVTASATAIRGALATGDYRAMLSHQALTPFVTVTYAIIGALVASRQPRNAIGWLFVSVGCLSALSALAAALNVYGTGLPFPADLAVWFGNWVWIPGIILPTSFVLLYFPDGQPPSPRWHIITLSAALGLAISVLVVMLHPGPLSTWGLDSNPYGIPGAAPTLDVLADFGSGLLAFGLIGSIAGFSVRFRRSAGIQGEQMKWLLYAGGLMLLGFSISSAVWFFWPDDPLMSEISIALTNLAILSIAVAATIAILRYRLYDINLIMNRTLVYATLTAGVVTLYVLLVGGLGALFQTRSSLLLSLLATGSTAILFQPLRERLQRAVNRLMYGERDNPYAVLSRLGRRLEASLSPESALPTVVETVAQALKLPYVAIALKQEGDFKITASYGLAQEEAVQLPLVYQGETVGRLILATRSLNEPFTPGEERLLEDIAHHIGVAAHAVQLTYDLRQLAADLQRSRQRLVTAREEERRRLRRDLHDGLGPILASQGLKLAALAQLVERDPPLARGLIGDLITQNEAVVADIRRLVYDLRPPALDELGLVDAIRDQVLLIKEEAGLQPQLQIRIEEPPGGLPPLPAAVEVAAYRIALEAVTNVSRHAGADACTVRFSVDEARSAAMLRLEVRDNGSGIPDEHRPGVGLISMKERAEEVGGQCLVESLKEGGTRVLARLPIFQ